MYGTLADPGVSYRYHRLLCGDWWDEQSGTARTTISSTSPAGRSPFWWWFGGAVDRGARVRLLRGHFVQYGSGSCESRFGDLLHVSLNGPTDGCVASPSRIWCSATGATTIARPAHRHRDARVTRRGINLSRWTDGSMRAIDPNLELALHPASSCLQIRTNWDLSEIGMTGYTHRMSKSSHFVKTTISVPNEVYVRATRRAKELGTESLSTLCSGCRKATRRRGVVGRRH